MVADLFSNIAALLCKLETAEGTDATPSGAANAIRCANFNFTPVTGQDEEKDLVVGWLGDTGVWLEGDYAQIEFDVFLAGSGTAGTPPGYSPLLLACGLSEAVVSETSVTYTPVSTGFDSASIYWYEGGVRHILLGARGTFTLNLTPPKMPRLRFTMMGLKGTITDQALPAADYSGFIEPVAVNKANTTLDLHSYTAVAESLELAIGNTVTPRFLIGEEAMRITDRKATGTAVVKADTLANKDWFAISKAHTIDALQAVHGTAAGNILTIDAPAVQIGRPSRGATDNVLNYSLPLRLKPDSGNDELSIAFT